MGVLHTVWLIGKNKRRAVMVVFSICSKSVTDRLIVKLAHRYSHRNPVNFRDSSIQDQE
jgi:hypothetical protein